MRGAAVFAGYAVVSAVFYGLRALPHLGRTPIGKTHDPEIFVWAFAWWPHAISSFTNPFVSHAVFAPEGVNLAWTTTVPFLAAAFWPVTAIVGPVASYNLAVIVLPAVAASTMFCLCLYLTRSQAAAAVGGFLFGFSSYITAHQTEGHLNLTGVFLLPVIVLIALKRLDRVIGGRRYACLVGATLAGQLLISTEVTLTATFSLIVTLLTGWAMLPPLRARLVSLARETLAGYGIAAVLASPLLVFVLLRIPHGSYTAAESSATDLANVVLPTRTNGLAGSLFMHVRAHFNDAESGLYLGLPTLMIIALLAWRRWAHRPTRVLLVLTLLAGALAFGTAIWVDGHRLMPFVGALARELPFVENVRFPRFSAYASLGAGIGVALWISQTRGRVFTRPYVLPLLAVGFLVPNVSTVSRLTTPDPAPFLTTHEARTCLTGETLAMFPYGAQGDSMLWQATSNFRFRLAGGYLYPVIRGAPEISSFDSDPDARVLNFYNDRYAPGAKRLLAFAARHRVDRFVLAADYPYPGTAIMRAVAPIQATGGLLIAPACGSPPLTRRDLRAYTSLADEQDASQKTLGWCLDGNYYEIPEGDVPIGLLTGAGPASYVEGRGIACTIPPGYVRHGLTPASLGVPADVYPYYVRAS